MLYRTNIDSLFSPESVAVIGASAEPGKLGNYMLSTIKGMGFKGRIYPVNPQGGTILGLPALRKLADIPEAPLDLGVICLPAEKTPACLEELGAIGARAAIILASGFREGGGVGIRLEAEVKKLAETHNIALLGPNSLGVVNVHHSLNATYGCGSANPGDLGFFSQSGALGMAIFEWARQRGFGFSCFAEIGNKSVLDESDLLAYLAEEPNTKVILGYLENVVDGPRFLQNAHLATRKKPVILLKGGFSRASAQVISSHTGVLSGSDMAYEAAFRQTGIIRARRMEDLFDMAQAFAGQPLPKGPGVGVISNAGGPSVIAADACELAGLTMARLSPVTLTALREVLPEKASFLNPVFTMHDAGAERFVKTIDLMLHDPAVHSLLVLLTPTPDTPVREIAAAVAAIPDFQDKPVFFTLIGGPDEQEAKTILARRQIPCYLFPESAINSIAAMYRHSQWKDYPLPVEVGYRHDVGMARKVIDEARSAGNTGLVEYQAQGILRAYELPVLEAKLARTSDEAVQFAKQIGYPVALKIASPQVAHKTDVQGVSLNLDTPDKVRSAFLDITARTMRANKRHYIAGCLVQSMAPANSREVVMGFKRDPRFGPMVLFGLGGIHVEAFKDISCRLAPLSLDDVHDMVREIKAFPILAGMRGEKPVKFTALEDILLILSQLALDFPEIQEVECNPVFVNEEGAYVADIRVQLLPASPLRTAPGEKE